MPAHLSIVGLSTSVVAAMAFEGIDGLVYTHPIGDVMHAAGPNIGASPRNSNSAYQPGCFV